MARRFVDRAERMTVVVTRPTPLFPASRCSTTGTLPEEQLEPELKGRHLRAVVGVSTAPADCLVGPFKLTSMRRASG